MNGYQTRGDVASAHLLHIVAPVVITATSNGARVAKTVQVRLTINGDELVTMLGRKAASNASGSSHAMHGALRAQVLP